MTKWNRIQLVKKLGLNTENSVLVTNPHNIRSMRRFTRGWSSFSVRSFSKSQEDGRVAPHYPILNRRLHLAQALMNNYDLGFNSIVAEGIDPADAVFAGACLKTLSADRYSRLHFEIARGPGTVRRVTNDGLIDVIYTYENKHLETHRESPVKLCDELERSWVYTIARMFDRIEKTDCIFEFSLYNCEVGYKHEHIIVWEVTPTC